MFFLFQDRTGSLLIRQDPSSGPRGGKDSIHLYRDGGFTKQDLAALVQGYQEAWSGLNGRDVSYRFVCLASGCKEGSFGSVVIVGLLAVA